MKGSNLLLFSGTKTVSGDSKLTPTKVGHRKGGWFFIKTTAVSGTGSPTLNVDIITYDEETEDWHVIGSFTEVTATGKEAIYIPDVGNKITTQYVIADTNPSFTWKVSHNLKD